MDGPRTATALECRGWDFDLKLAGRYWTYASKRYVLHGRPTPEQFHTKTAAQQLLRLYENDPADDSLRFRISSKQ
jgi:hypothetical protein